MRKKVWTSTPIFIILSIVMAFMAGISYSYSFRLFVIEIVTAIVAMIIVAAYSLRFKLYMNKIISKAITNIKGINQSYFERFKMPVILVGKYGEILWSNSRFKKRLYSAKNPVNENVSIFLDNKKIDEISDVEGYDICWEGKRYTVYVTELEDSYLCMFIDDTYYKDTVKKYIDSQKSVALIIFDNYDEFANNSEENSMKANLSLETLLLRYANENEALFKKLSTDRYMIVFDKVHLDMEIAKQFPVLKEVRSIKYNQMEVTISIGIGNGCDSLVESEQNAKKALDMALGRGGDQVVVNEKGEYAFFGGVSEGIEKLSKVRTRIIANSIQKVVAESDKVFIMGHCFADMDCVGASVGLQPVMKRNFKKYSKIIIDYDTSTAQQLIDEVKKENSEIFTTPAEALKEITPKTLLIVVDTHIPDFVQSKEVLDKCKRVVVIDHHRKMVNFIDNSLVFFHEPMCSSASEMVTELLTYMGDNAVTKIQANALLAGIMLDTKNFIVRTGVRTFEAAAFLRKNGANTIETRALFANNIEMYREKYKIISNVEIYNNCAVAIAHQDINNIRVIASQSADELLSLSDVSASFVIYKTDNVVNISSRSYGKLNVQLVMEKLGGGGHQNMAAAQLENISLEEGKSQLIELIEQIEIENVSDK